MIRDTKKRSKAVSKRQPSEVRRVPVGFRISPTLRQQLEEAATKRGRSLSQEAEFRLESTFAAMGLVGETLTLAYGDDAVRTGLAVMDTLHAAQNITDNKAIIGPNYQLVLSTFKDGLLGSINKWFAKLEEGGK